LIGRKNVKLLIFDLDGTLVDSAGQILKALDLACDESGLEHLPKHVFMRNLGLPIKSIISYLGLSTEVEEKLIQIFRNELRILIEDSNSLFDGVEEFLRDARELDYLMAIATSKPTYLAELVVANSPLARYIDFTQGTDGFAAKPAPDVILKCLSYFKTDCAIMFGDRVEDVASAQSAGISSIGIAQSFHTVNELTAGGANFAFKSFFELQSTVEIDIFLRDLVDDKSE
jgi:phosphoglycolate phosphatase